VATPVRALGSTVRYSETPYTAAIAAATMAALSHVDLEPWGRWLGCHSASSMSRPDRRCAWRGLPAPHRAARQRRAPTKVAGATAQMPQPIVAATSHLGFSCSVREDKRWPVSISSLASVTMRRRSRAAFKPPARR